jgi:NADH-quinone oxidoreductase subunit I
MKVVHAERLSFLKRLFMVDLIKGLLLTFSYQRPSANYTEQYPKVRPKVAERYRGAPRLNNDPTDGSTLCIACNLCALACPEFCIEVGSGRNEAGKKELTTFTFDISRCMFCGLCEDACPTPCLELTQDFELALYGRRDMKWDRQKLEQGNQPVLYTK